MKETFANVASGLRLRWGALILLTCGVGGGLADDAGPPAFPGTPSQWQGYRRYDFEVAGHPALVVAPAQSAAGRPWVWHGEFFGHKPAPDIALLQRGFHIV